MFEAFSRSWDITKSSMKVIKADKEMLVFPILSSIFSIIFFLAMVIPSFFALFGANVVPESADLLFYAILFVTYLGLAFIATFFNVCVVYTAKKRFAGGNATFGESLGFAISKIPLIFMWALVSATVGVILRLLDHAAERLPAAGQIVAGIIISLLGMAWSIITIFVVPVLVYEGLGPFAAIKKSVSVLKKTWGESLIRHMGIGFAQFLSVVCVLAIGVALTFIGAMIAAPVALFFLILTVIGVLFTLIFFGVLNSVFNVALYVYATTGKVPNQFNAESVKGAFTEKRR